MAAAGFRRPAHLHATFGRDHDRKRADVAAGAAERETGALRGGAGGDEDAGCHEQECERPDHRRERIGCRLY